MHKTKSQVLVRAAGDSELTGLAVRTLIVIADWANTNDDCRCFRSIEDLRADLGGASERGVRKAIAQLVERGFIEADRRGGRGHASDFRLLTNPAQPFPHFAENPEQMCRLSDLNPEQECRVSTKKAAHLFRKPGTSVPPIPEEPEKDITHDNETDCFNEFWSLYPRKVGKPSAEKAFRKATKRAGTDGADAVMVSVRLFASEWQGKLEGLTGKARDDQLRYCPHPATWLNDDRWRVEPAAPGPLEVEVSDDDWRIRLRILRDKGQWSEERWGPRPGSARCHVPINILSEFHSTVPSR